MAETIKIGGELESTATGNVVAAASAIKDKVKNKYQDEINAETDATLNNHASAIQGLNSQNYVTVTATDQTTDVTDVLPATGAANTIYRIGNWDGSQFDASVYSEYAWNGSAYVHITTKTQVGEVFDISAYHATGGTLATYADLSAALDSNNGGGVPQSLQEGGMSVKFVRTYDNKYVRYNLLAQTFTTDTTQWAIAEEGVYVENPEFIRVYTDKDNRLLWAIKTDGSIYYGAGCPQQVKDYIEEKISSLSLDEYEDIVAFLSDYLGSDITLKAIIDGINERTPELINDSEFIQITTDNEDKILEGITSEGVKQINLPIDTPSASMESTENPEWLSVTTDSKGRMLRGRKKDGTAVENVGIESPTIDAIIGNISSLDGRVSNLEENIPGIEYYYGAAGDSITESVRYPIDDETDPYNPITGTKAKSWAYYIAKKYNMGWYNYGDGGSTLGDCIVANYNQRGFSKENGRYTQMANNLTHITIWFGWNDLHYGPRMRKQMWVQETYQNDHWYPAKDDAQYIGTDGYVTQEEYDAVNAVTGSVGGIQYDNSQEYWNAVYVGTKDDNTNKTYWGAWNIILPYLINKYPFAKILLISPYATSELMRQCVRDAAFKFGLQCYDFGKDQNQMFAYGWQDESEQGMIGDISIEQFRTRTLLVDGVHPNLDGNKYIAPSIGAKLVNL